MNVIVANKSVSLRLAYRCEWRASDTCALRAHARRVRTRGASPWFPCYLETTWP